MSVMTIGRLAAAAGVNVETIRFYQRIGLMPAPDRPMGGVRRYSERDADRLRFVRRAQELGFSLAEVRQLLDLEDGRNCAQARSLAVHKVDLVQAKIDDLERMREALSGLVARCGRRRGRIACPIITTLSGRTND